MVVMGVAYDNLPMAYPSAIMMKKNETGMVTYTINNWNIRDITGFGGESFVA